MKYLFYKSELSDSRVLIFHHHGFIKPKPSLFARIAVTDIQFYYMAI